jgi:hypothetical protein
MDTYTAPEGRSIDRGRPGARSAAGACYEKDVVGFATYRDRGSNLEGHHGVVVWITLKAGWTVMVVSKNGTVAVNRH